MMFYTCHLFTIHIVSTPLKYALFFMEISLILLIFAGLSTDLFKKDFQLII
jgi:hypothetical protein